MRKILSGKIVQRAQFQVLSLVLVNAWAVCSPLVPKSEQVGILLFAIEQAQWFFSGYCAMKALLRFSRKADTN